MKSNAKNLLTLVVVAAAAPASFGQLFSDNFNSYTTDGQLTAVWERVSGTEPSIGLEPDPLNAGNQTVAQTTAAGRLRHTVTGVTPTAGSPITYSFDFYDSNGGTTTGRIYGEIRQSVNASGLLAAGLFNSVTTGTFAQGRYQARNLDNGGWIQLDAVRSIGWHNFRFQIDGSSVSLFVDNVVDPQFNGLSLGAGFASYSYDWLHLGSALTSNTGGNFDNVVFNVVPEPSTYATIFGGLLMVGAVARRYISKKA